MAHELDGGDPGRSTPSAPSLTLALVGPEATEALGEALGRAAVAGDVIALHGELGAGKTTLTRGLAVGLGVPDDVASPTYILMDAHTGGRLPLYHFDAWMEGREKALFLDGGDEGLRSEGVAVVEWAGRVAAWLPAPRLEVELRHVCLAERLAVLRVVEGEGTAGGTRPGAAGYGARLAALVAALAPLPGVRVLAGPSAGAAPRAALG